MPRQPQARTPARKPYDRQAAQPLLPTPPQTSSDDAGSSGNSRAAGNSSAAVLYSGSNEYLRGLALVAAEMKEGLEPLKGEPEAVDHLRPVDSMAAVQADVSKALDGLEKELYGEDQGKHGFLRTLNRFTIFRKYRAQVWGQLYPKLHNGQKSMWISVEYRRLSDEERSFWVALYDLYAPRYAKYLDTRSTQVEAFRAKKQKERRAKAQEKGAEREQASSDAQTRSEDEWQATPEAAMPPPAPSLQVANPQLSIAPASINAPPPPSNPAAMPASTIYSVPVSAQPNGHLAPLVPPANEPEPELDEDAVFQRALNEAINNDPLVMTVTEVACFCVNNQISVEHMVAFWGPMLRIVEDPVVLPPPPAENVEIDPTWLQQQPVPVYEQQQQQQQHQQQQPQQFLPSSSLQDMAQWLPPPQAQDAQITLFEDQPPEDSFMNWDA
ncbi:hypothetical protein IAT40_007450 [Kwoniella sp. CBS 6097]